MEGLLARGMLMLRLYPIMQINAKRDSATIFTSNRMEFQTVKSLLERSGRDTNVLAIFVFKGLEFDPFKKYL